MKVKLCPACGQPAKFHTPRLLKVHQQMSEAQAKHRKELEKIMKKNWVPSRNG